MPHWPIPTAIADAIRGCHREAILRSRASSYVEFLDAPDARPLVLKIAPELRPEMQRLNWLKDMVPVPEVIAFASDDNCDSLLMTRLPGRDGTDVHEEMGGQAFIELFAGTLRNPHATPAQEDLVVESTDSMLALAAERVDTGLLRPDDFPANYLGQPPSELLAILHRIRPADSPLVITHGDASLPNFLFEDHRLSGIIDLGQAAVSDPWRDLAIASRSIIRNMESRWPYPLFDAYGVEFDEQRIEFHDLLDQFVMPR